MKTLVKIIAVSAAASSLVMASGWRIPEQSAKSVALSGAYIANANGADSSYYNPANMSFNKDAYEIEADIMGIALSKIDYKDNHDATKDAASEGEYFLVPTLFFSSKEFAGFRFGANIVAPGGLSKRWEENAYQKTYAKEFTLEIIEFNPVVSYKILNNLSVGGGLRVLYSHGVVENEASTASRELEGDTIEYGYNLALSYKPVSAMNVALTYRSNVDLKEEGNAKLYVSGTKVYDGGADVTVPLPAVFDFALSYEFGTDTTIELVYERTFWSKYKALDFNYNDPIPVVLRPSFDNPKTKNWDDSDAFRIGATQRFSGFDLMVGFAYDQNPIPDEKVAFELPDSDAILISFGGTFYIGKSQSITAGYLLDMKKTRNATNPEAGVDGEFSNAKAHLGSIAYRLAF